MDHMSITAAKYNTGRDGKNLSISATIDGVQMSVPLDPANRHYAAILKAVEEGTLTIQEATA